jgi:hypothetical protein
MNALVKKQIVIGALLLIGPATVPLCAMQQLRRTREVSVTIDYVNGQQIAWPVILLVEVPVRGTITSEYLEKKIKYQEDTLRELLGIRGALFLKNLRLVISEKCSTSLQKPFKMDLFTMGSLHAALSCGRKS